MATRLYPLRKADYTISSGYGPRDGGFHYGLDFAAKDGTPFYACQAGTVQYIGAADGYGQWLVIDSDESEGAGCLEYGHMWNAFATGLKVGSHVEAGQLIGYVGANGQATGPHLHLAVHVYDYASAYTDPATWLAGSGYPGGTTTPATPTSSTGAPAVATKPAFREIDMMGNNRSDRWGAIVSNFYLHTEEGNASAVGLANSLNNRDDASYHYTLRDSILCDVVDTDYASWSVLDANPSSINLCFAGSRASFSRADWLARDNDLRIAAYIAAAQDSKKYGFGTRVIAPPYVRAKGISDHKYVTLCLGIGSHTDVGNNFPWDVFARYVTEYAGGTVTAPPVNQIDLEATRAKAWIGSRITKGENVCPDGRGRWAQFEHAYIYWTPTTGAHAIPTAVFETWAGLKFEAGALGYPIGDHTVLADGVVQGFEHGAIYRRNGQPGFFVTGDIRSHWNRSGFEGGPYGWPVSNEIVTKSGTRYQVFEKGRLVWSPDRVVGLVPQDGPDIIN